MIEGPLKSGRWLPPHVCLPTWTLGTEVATAGPERREDQRRVWERGQINLRKQELAEGRGQEARGATGRDFVRVALTEVPEIAGRRRNGIERELPEVANWIPSVSFK